MSGFFPHRIVMGVLMSSALLAGVAILPGSNERIAMLERDGHTREALGLLEQEYANGNKSYRTLYQMQALYESEGNTTKSREMLEAMVAANPRDPSIRARLVQFYKNADDQDAYRRALKGQIDAKYSEGACRELIASERLAGNFKAEQSAIQQCRQRGYRRADDLTRLAELEAADGDTAQASAILKSIDDLKRLKSPRERYQLLALLLDQDQPKEAERRAVRWIRSGKDDALAIGLVDMLAQSKFQNLAIETAKEAGVPGDSISLTVAERLIERSEMTAAQLYLKGWLDNAKAPPETVAARFAEDALAAGDAATAYKGAQKFGFEHVDAVLLLRLASELANGGQLAEAEQVQKVIANLPAAGVPQSPIILPPGEGAADNLAVQGENTNASVRRPALAPYLTGDPLERWRSTLWSKMSDDALRRAQALGLAMPPAASAAERQRGHGEARGEVRGASNSKVLKKTNRVLQRNSRIKSLRHHSRGGPRDHGNRPPYGTSPVPAPNPVQKPQPN